jgi:hypothetical protein
MCQFASFKFQPCGNVPVVVADLFSHGETEKTLKLPPDAGADGWHDGHYLPTGEILCRGVDGDTLTPRQCESAIRARWPTFTAFWSWAMRQPGCKTLTGLYLCHTKVADLSPLAGCKTLTWLDLCRTEVTDLSPLAGCKALASLDLSYTEVADLSPLSGCKALTWLVLFGTKVTESQVAALRLALPKCKVST